MNIIPLEKLIPSKDIRTQCENENHIFSLREQAALVYSNHFLPHAERLDLLKKLLETINTEYPQEEELALQIQQRIDTQIKMKKTFYSNDRNSVYRIIYQDIDRKKVVHDDYLFSDINKALDYATKEIKDYALNREVTIEKRFLNQESHIQIVYDRNNTLMDVNSYNMDPYRWHDNRFEESFIDLPYPFRNGDFVHYAGINDIGIFSGCKNEEEYIEKREWNKTLQKNNQRKDISDVSCRVEFPQVSLSDPNRIVFSHSHLGLLNLEYAPSAENSPFYKLLKAGQELMRGEGSLELLCMKLNK